MILTYDNTLRRECYWKAVGAYYLQIFSFSEVFCKKGLHIEKSCGIIIWIYAYDLIRKCAMATAKNNGKTNEEMMTPLTNLINKGRREGMLTSSEVL